MSPHDTSCSSITFFCEDENSYSCKSTKTSQCTQPAIMIPPSFPLRSPRALSSSSNRVSFNECIMVTRIIHINDYTAEEIRACWYNDKEFSAIKTQCISQMMRTTELLKQKNVVSIIEDQHESGDARGLEYFIESVAETRQKTSQMAIWAVLREQYLQREEGSFDPEFISEIYERQSSLARVQACITGVNDRLEAMS